VRDPSGHIDRDTFDLTVEIGGEGKSLSGTRVVGAHPNPFNSTTRVVFELAERQRVSVQIYDLQGRLVRTLEEGNFDPGRYEKVWNGYNNARRTVSSGAYFVRMLAGDRAEHSKILLLK